MKRLVIVGILTMFLVGLLPSVFADTNNYFELESISLTCGPSYGTYTVNYSYQVLAGSLLRLSVVQVSPTWITISYSVDNPVPSAMSASGTLGGLIPPDGSVQVTYELYNPDGSLASSSTLYAECPSGIAWVHSLLWLGCMLPIPSTAVGGSFVQNAETFWMPGETVSPPVVIEVGNTAHVLGVDATGAYYKIIWGCQYLWVPVETMGPNFDDVWNGAPLPTEVVE